MKKFLLTGVACTLVAFVLSFVIHGVLLESYYAALATRGIFRTPEESSNYFYLMIVAHVLIGSHSHGYISAVTNRVSLGISRALGMPSRSCA